jgi:hypothetical protein
MISNASEPILISALKEYKRAENRTQIAAAKHLDLVAFRFTSTNSAIMPFCKSDFVGVVIVAKQHNSADIGKNCRLSILNARNAEY